ncbi:MAG: hypothetical protein K6L76_02370 [Agarilytica sp.]
MILKKFQTWNGDRYRLIAREEGLLPHGVEPVAFYDSDSAVQFIRNLKASESDWRGLLRDFCGDVAPNNVQHIEHVFADKLVKGKLRAVKLSGKTSASKKAHSFSSGTGVIYQIKPSVDLLEGSADRTKNFADQKQAEKFIDSLGASETQLEAIAKDLGVAETKVPKKPAFNQASPSKSDQLKQSIAKALSENNAAVVEKNVPAPPASKSSVSQGVAEIGHMAGNRQAGLGPVVDEVQTESKAIVCGVCEIEKLDISCGHGRFASRDGIIQVVPDPDKNTTHAIEMFGVKVSVGKKYGGKEKIKSVLSLDGNKLSDCHNITGTDGEVREIASLTEIIEFPGEKTEKWLAETVPKEYLVAGRGCSGSSKTVRIQTYPSDTYTVSGELKIFKDWADKVNEAWEDWGKKVFNLAPIDIKPEVQGPAGSFSASWGWKEDKDWKTYYDLSLNFGLNPILGIAISLKVSLAKIGLTALGMPPIVAEFAANHLADIFLTAGASCQGSLVGAPHYKFFPDGTEQATGDAKFSVEGAVLLAVSARVGSDYVVSCQADIEGKCKVTAEDMLDISRKEVAIQTTIKLDPFIGTVRLTTKMFKIKSKTKEKEWKPWGAVDLYKSEPKKLL